MAVSESDIKGRYSAVMAAKNTFRGAQNFVGLDKCPTTADICFCELHNGRPVILISAESFFNHMCSGQ